MTINTVVKGDVDGIRNFGLAINAAGRRLIGASDDAASAGTTSTSSWIGGAGEGFRMVMSKLDGFADGLATKAGATGAGIVVFAGDLQGVRTHIAGARQVAKNGGLTLTATSILPPGPAPRQPGALPPNATPEQTTAHGNAVTAANAHAKKVKAYLDAGKMVTSAHTNERAAQLKLGAGPLKDLASMTDIGVGAVTGVAEAASVLRVNQTKLDTMATIAANAYKNASTPEKRAIKLKLLANAAIEAERFRVAAEGNLVSRFGARQPQWPKTMLTKPLVGGIPKPQARRLVPKAPGPKPSAWLRAKDGAKALGRVPLVGIGLAALGVGLAIASSTDPVKAVASGVAGAAVGAATGAAAFLLDRAGRRGRRCRRRCDRWRRGRVGGQRRRGAGLRVTCCGSRPLDHRSSWYSSRDVSPSDTSRTRSRSAIWSAWVRSRPWSRRASLAMCRAYSSSMVLRPWRVSRMRTMRPSVGSGRRSTRFLPTMRSMRLVIAPEVTIDDRTSWPGVSS